MGTRGRYEHCKLRFGDFAIKSTTDGHKYVEFNTERGTKTKTDETEKGTNADARIFKPKVWATPDTPSRCPVRLYQAFIQRCAHLTLLFVLLSITTALQCPIGTRNSH